MEAFCPGSVLLYTVKQIGCFNCRVVTQVAWLTVVSEAIV